MADSGPIPFDDTQPGFPRELLDQINARFDRGAQRMARIEATVQGLHASVAENTAITKRIDENTKGLVELSVSLDKVLGLLERLAKWMRPLGWIAGAIAAGFSLWTAVKSGIVPGVGPK